MEMRETEQETARSKLVKDSVLDGLFNVHAEPHPEQCVHTERNRSSHTTEADDEAHVNNKEKT